MISLLLASLTALAGFAAWYHCRDLARSIKHLQDDLAEERDLRHQADEAQAQYALLLARQISDLEQHRGQGIILFSHPRDRN